MITRLQRHHPLAQAVGEELLRVRRRQRGVGEARRTCPRCRSPTSPGPRSCRTRRTSASARPTAAPHPNENRLVRKWNPNTAISTTPKITHVVGCVNAAAMRDQEQRGPRAPRRSRRVDERDHQRQQEQHRDVVEVADVRRGEEQRRPSPSIVVSTTSGSRRLRKNAAPSASPVRIGITDHQERAEAVPIDARPPAAAARPRAGTLTR